MLAGKRLFRADDEAATVARVLMSEVRPPSEMSPESPAGLDAVVLRALERDPSKRFVSAEEMARAIEQVQPPADVASVAAWVKQTAAEELARRADGVRALEVDLVEDGTLVTAPPRLRRRWIPAAAVAVSIAGFALVQWGLLAPSRATTAASAAASEVPSAAPAVAPPAVVPADVSPPAPSTAALTLPAVAPSTVPAPTRPPARRPAPKPTTGRREHLYSQD
jgi:serine/threonine-protein kinase